jgi:hypothetical protein
MSEKSTVEVKAHAAGDVAREQQLNIANAKNLLMEETKGSLSKLKDQIVGSKSAAFKAKNIKGYNGEIVDAKSSFDSWKSTIEALQYNMNFTDVAYKSLPLNVDNRPEGSKLLSRGLRLVQDKDNFMQRLDKFLADPNITKLSDTKVYQSEYLQAKKLFDQLKLDADRLKNRKSILDQEIQVYKNE